MQTSQRKATELGSAGANVDAQSLIRTAIREQVNEALGTGGMVTAAFCLFAGIGVVLALTILGGRIWILPLIAVGVCLGYGLLISWAGRNQKVHGGVRYALVIPFVSIPTLYFICAELILPGGAATYITGPFSHLYLFLIGMTGYLFSFRVSFVAGLVAAAGYMLAFALSHSTLSAIQAPDELLKSGLTSYFIAGNKSLIMIAMGAITGGVSRISRRLLLRVLEEEREKEVVQRVFGQYVSEVVSDRILSRATNMTGESAHVVILFSDLRGFSAFSEGRDPAEIVSRLNAYFERMVAAIRSEHGVVDKFIGDAVMAVFGGLVELEDPATSAVRAARKMRTSLTELNAEWAKAGLEPFDNGIGLHIGEVILGPLGCEDRMEFTAIGDAVNTAARLEGLCKDKAFPLLITGALYDELEAGEREGFESLGEVSVKGKQVPLRVYGTHG